MTTDSRKMILTEISVERDRQYHLPGSEYDQTYSINDWIAIASQYLTRGASRKHVKPDAIDQRDALIKTAAIILAAVEHLDRKIN